MLLSLGQLHNTNQELCSYGIFSVKFFFLNLLKQYWYFTDDEFVCRQTLPNFTNYHVGQKTAPNYFFNNVKPGSILISFGTCVL